MGKINERYQTPGQALDMRSAQKGRVFTVTAPRSDAVNMITHYTRSSLVADKEF